jgi:hypothetical protein
MRFSVGAGFSYLTTDLVFESNRDTVDFEQWAVVAVGTYALPGGFALQLGVGAAVASSLAREEVGAEIDEELATRFLVSGFVSRRFQWGDTVAAFVSPSVGFGAAYASDYSATDMRIGVQGGMSFSGRLSPYLVARGFGGPINWDDRTGTDAHHYSLGGGLSANLPGQFIVSAEGSFLGEKGASLAVVRGF